MFVVRNIYPRRGRGGPLENGALFETRRAAFSRLLGLGLFGSGVCDFLLGDASHQIVEYFVDVEPRLCRSLDVLHLPLAGTALC